jgi:hypothetical protein
LTRDPDGTTATAYCWLIWVHGKPPMPPFDIPPGCRKALTRSSDRPRFAPWSLKRAELPSLFAVDGDAKAFGPDNQASET